MKELATLRAAFAETAAYLPPSQEDEEHWNFADLGLELSRPARGLRIWLPLWLHGASAFRAALDEKLELARAAAERVRALPGVRIVAEPELSLFVFRVEPPDMNAGELDGFNRRVLARINQRKRLMLTGTTLQDPARGEEVFVIRVCVLCFRTHADRIDMLIEDLAEAIADPRG